jgi:hypothetical protein
MIAFKSVNELAFYLYRAFDVNASSASLESMPVAVKNHYMKAAIEIWVSLKNSENNIKDDMKNDVEDDIYDRLSALEDFVESVKDLNDLEESVEEDQDTSRAEVVRCRTDINTHEDVMDAIYDHLADLRKRVSVLEELTASSRSKSYAAGDAWLGDFFNTPGVTYHYMLSNSTDPRNYY